MNPPRRAGTQRPGTTDPSVLGAGWARRYDDAAVPHHDVLHPLRRLLKRLQTDWYAMGRGDEFEDAVRRYRAEGRWPFDIDRDDA